MLEHKAARYGREFYHIDRFAPTSQVCSVYGVKDGPKPLHVPEWTCSGYGAVSDRDINAAVNVANAVKLTVSACGEQVRPQLSVAQRVEAGSLEVPRITRHGRNLPSSGGRGSQCFGGGRRVCGCGNYLGHRHVRRT